MLWNNNQQSQDQNITVNYVPTQASGPKIGAADNLQNKTTESVKPEPSVNAKDLSIISAVAREVISNNIGTNQRLDLKVPKPAPKITQNPALNSDSIKGSKRGLSDKEYIAIFNEVNSKQKPVKKEYSKEDALKLPANNKTTPANDHFNKIDVSQYKLQQTKILTLTQQVAAAVAAGRKETTNSSKNESNNNDGWKNYLSSLKEAETERQNEVRTITVQRGETLWKISTRAYGSGHLYKKIFAANPHLTSPDSISVGETLRVPL